MHRFSTLALLALLLLGFGLGSTAVLAQEAGGALPRDAIHLVVLHTNDVHGQALPRRATWIRDREVHVGGLGRVAAYVQSLRREHQGPGRGLLLVDGGDWFQGTPEGQVGRGKPFVEALSALEYDALAVGNHEWDLGEGALRDLLGVLGERAVVANVRTEPGGPRLPWLRPYRVVSIAGLKIALVGLVAVETPYITHPDARRYHFADPREELARVLAELPKDVDLVLPLSHCGLEADRDLALRFPQLPLVIGGHSHTFLREPVRVGETRLVQAGSKATVVGRVDLWIDRRTKRVLELRARLVELDQEPESDQRHIEVDRRVEALVRAASAALDEVVGEIVEAPHPGGPLRSSGLGNWISDAMASFLSADVAIHNKGGIRATLVPGPITRRAVFEVFPFDNTAVRMELSGEELDRLVRRALEGEGRRGFEFSGMTVAVVEGPSGTEVVRIRVGGADLDPARRYRVATNSFLAGGGDRIFDLGRELAVEDSGVLLRDLMERELGSKRPFPMPNEDRIERRSAPR